MSDATNKARVPSVGLMGAKEMGDKKVSSLLQFAWPQELEHEGRKVMSKHTPGPWILGSEDWSRGRAWSVVRPGSQDDDERAAIEIHEQDNGEADARLIAAAPDMLAALQEAVRLYETHVLMAGPTGALARVKWSNRAHAAIRKATGEQS